MTEEKQLELANRYKHVQKRLTVAVMIFIIIFGLALIGCATVLIISSQEFYIIFLVSIMYLLGIFDLFLSVKFNSVTQKKIDKLDNKTAFERYVKIHGLDSLKK